jgi:hypothetical protein
MPAPRPVDVDEFALGIEPANAMLAVNEINLALGSTTMPEAGWAAPGYVAELSRACTVTRTGVAFIPAHLLLRARTCQREAVNAVI